MHGLALDPRFEANQTLANFWPHHRLPVDSIAIARCMGLEVHDTPSSRRLPSVLIKRADGAPTIFLSAKDGSVQKRFACAREIGHFLWHAEESEYVTGGTGGSTQDRSDPEARFGHAFATHLLVPEAWLRARALSDHEPSMLSIMFGVPLDEVRMRLSVTRPAPSPTTQGLDQILRRIQHALAQWG